MVLKANGYAEFKIKKHKNTFIVDIEREDYNKPKFAEFTGAKYAIGVTNATAALILSID